mmetsp:Transcript_12539/g.15567  ORF Transcript_12539/g.15567 Transcript_12539/m.15567 type:complete len:86 (-) Transcript_12539:95-352(-)
MLRRPGIRLLVCSQWGIVILAKDFQIEINIGLLYLVPLRLVVNYREEDTALKGHGGENDESNSILPVYHHGDGIIDSTWVGIFRT